MPMLRRATGALALVLGVATAADLSPVTRVVQLLENLSKQVDEEAKKEEDLYETFVCWSKSIISQKTETNAAANSRIDTLETYIKDLDAGRIELTTERADLEKEIETLRGDLEVAKELREKETSEFEDAKAEMQKGIDALTSAIEVLKTAGEEQPEGSLMAIHSSLNMGAEARAKEASRLNLAVTIGQKMLTAGDSIFLQRLLLGEVPNPDWKKLNRKATFKMSYKSRSDKIQGVLQKMLDTFASNLDDATKKEADAQALYDKLKTAKDTELTAAEEALGKMENENGARGLSKTQAQEEVDALKQQVTDDSKYIQQVKDAAALKKTEWKDRKELRTGELAAISKAISILHSDDARDLFKKSFSSQGFLFLQEASSTEVSMRHNAAEALRMAATQTHDRRLAALATRVAASAAGHFDEVITAIDNMLSMLQTEEDEDLRIKETCETDRGVDTRSAILASRKIDEHTDAITVLEAKIEELTREVKEKMATVEEIKEQLKVAKEDRDKENAEFVVAKQDDTDAAALVKSAQETLSSFYADNQLMLVQGKKHQQSPFQSTAGEAPPPPPPTWDGGYGGKTDEATGIVAILGLVHEDILADITKAEEDEAASLALYEKTKLALETERDDLTTAIGVLNSTKATAEGDVEDHKGNRLTKKGELDVVMQKIKDAEPGCAFFQINFPQRSANRHAEIDGLHKAKAILSGGSFSKPEDPNRAMKPGDALLQRRRLAPVARHA